MTNTRATAASAPPRQQLETFRALSDDIAPRDVQELMAYPFFSLAKSRRTAPINFRSGDVTVRVEGTVKHGIATIWDADIMIWAASQIVSAQDGGIGTSRFIRATPYEILRYIGRGTSLRDYQRLRAALDRLQTTSIATSIRETTGRRLHRFSLINEWKECASLDGRPCGIELVLPDWFYTALLNPSLVLTIDAEYFQLTGGYRTLALSTCSQTRRSSVAGMAVRDGASSPQIRKSRTPSRLRLRSTCRCQPTTPAGLRTVDLSYAKQRRSAVLFSRMIEARPDVASYPHDLGISCGQPVDSVVLSGALNHVLSSALLSCYRARKRSNWRGGVGAFRGVNCSNSKPLTNNRDTATGEQRLHRATQAGGEAR